VEHSACSHLRIELIRFQHAIIVTLVRHCFHLVTLSVNAVVKIAASCSRGDMIKVSARIHTNVEMTEPNPRTRHK
jgi:hypothetical protein